jgi:hypothetical protein
MVPELAHQRGRIAELCCSGRAAVFEQPPRGALVEDMHVELVDHKPPAGADELAQDAARFSERLDVVQREHRDGSVEVPGGSSQLVERDRKDVRGSRRGIDCHDLVPELCQ